MGSNLKKEYILDNLGCANCAAKMELKLNNMNEVNVASINFITKKLIIEFKESSILELQYLQDLDNYIISKISEIVTSIESGVIVSPLEKTNISDNDKSDSRKQPTTQHTNGSYTNSNKKKLENKIDFTILIRLAVGFLISFVPILLKMENQVGLAIILLGYLILGFDVLVNSFKSIRKGQIFDENFLIVVATIGALIIGEYPEGLTVMLLYQIGEFLQDLAVDKSRRQLTSAMNLKADYANIQTSNGIEKVTPEAVLVDDIIIIKPSEKIPLDGIVIDGTSFVDTSSLTGEAVPKKTCSGDEVLSGCINGASTLFVKVTKTYSNSTVAKVLDLVENATNRKSITENFITKFARIYTPVVVFIAILLSVVPPILTKTYDFGPWIYKACGFLVVSCPCALVISIPLGFFGGIGCASKHGILIKGSNYLEALNFVETAVFDKTGTLTKGSFLVTKINLSNHIDTMTQERLLHMAAIIESFSTHPIAKSIVSGYNKPLNTSVVTNYEEIAGMGIRANFDEMTILLGNAKLLESNHVIFDDITKSTLGTVTYIAIDSVYAGNIIVSDTIKPDAKDAVTNLKSLGIHSIMLTGDTQTAALLVSKEVGIDTVYSQLLPTDKVDKIEELLSKTSVNKKVLFVGDGINDAPVLARADIGIAMGGLGSDAAIEAADIVIMTDEPSKIALAIRIAKRTKNIVTQNIILALGIKFLVMVLLSIGYSSMWLAVFADVGVALIAILNSIRALTYE